MRWDKKERNETSDETIRWNDGKPKRSDNKRGIDNWTQAYIEQEPAEDKSKSQDKNNKYLTYTQLHSY